MGNYEILKATVAELIKENGRQDITGSTMQGILFSIINAVGKYGSLVGIATPSTNPGVIDGKAYYIATAPGIYVNFGAAKIEKTGIYIFDNFSTSGWTLSKLVDLSAITDDVAELKRQVEGTSETADASRYPQIQLGSFETIAAFNSYITDRTKQQKYCGRLRATVEGQSVEVWQFAVDANNGVYMQLAIGNLDNNSEDGVRTELALSDNVRPQFWRRRSQKNAGGYIVWSVWQEALHGGCVLDMGVVTDSNAAFDAAAADAVTGNSMIREIRWRTSNSTNNGGSGDGGTIFQERRGSYYVVQWMMFEGQGRICKARSIVTGNDKNVGAWQEILLPFAYGYDAASRMLRSKSIAVDSGNQGRWTDLVELPLATYLQAGLMSAGDKTKLLDLVESYDDGSIIENAELATTTRKGLMSADDKRRLDNLRGITTESSAREYPFIFLGSFEDTAEEPGKGLADFNAALNGMAGEGVDTNTAVKFCGRVRARINGVNVEIYQFATSYAAKHFTQLLFGNVRVSAEDAGKVVLSGAGVFGMLTRACISGTWGDWKKYGETSTGSGGGGGGTTALIPGKGINIEGSEISVNAGEGLAFDPSERITLSKTYLKILENMAFENRNGAGLAYNEAGKLTLDLGEGLELNSEGQVVATGGSAELDPAYKEYLDKKLAEEFDSKFSVAISASKNPIEKGTGTAVTLTGTANNSTGKAIERLELAIGTSAVKTGTTSPQTYAHTASDTFTAKATLKLVGYATTKEQSVTVNAYYPIYTGVSTKETIAAADFGTALTKYGTISPTAVRKYDYTIPAGGGYPYLAVPAGVTAPTKILVLGAEAGMVKQGTVTVNGVAYQVFRPTEKQAAGAVSVQYA